VKKKIAVIYPWHSPMSMDTGAGQRIGLLIDHLSTFAEAIRVLSIGGKQGKVGNVEYITYSHSRRARILANVQYKSLHMLAAGSLSKNKRKGHIYLFLYYRFLLDMRYWRLIRRLVDWADVILVEYTFTAKGVIRAARKAGKKVILTDYDVVAQNSHVPPRSRLQKAILSKELEALRMADIAVSVSTEDRDCFLANGVDTEVIHHGIRLPAPPGLNAEVQRRRLEAYGGIPLRNRPLCLFVGSDLSPNIEAANSLYDISCAMPNPLEVDQEESIPIFITVGKCSQLRRTPNFISMGFIDPSILVALYRVAALVVIPLRNGTGASLKTIEAMSYGRALIGTRVAFRGYPVEPGNNCIVEDDINKYPERIIGLLKDDEGRARIERGALAFSSKYDYRMVYEKYREMIDSLAR
jgi:glycosyltransferase involved in cell wall biosynthesis